VAPETIRRLERALRLLVRSGLNTAQALARIREELAGDPDVDYLVAFIESAKRGVHKSAPRGGRTGGGEADGEP
jgi:UDP-N-acetylglucosamine acyltransferase